VPVIYEADSQFNGKSVSLNALKAKENFSFSYTPSVI
jgi:hypothetical protein